MTFFPLNILAHKTLPFLFLFAYVRFVLVKSFRKKKFKISLVTSFTLLLPKSELNEFDDFCTKFDLLLSNINQEFPLCSIATEDFNACCSRCWQNDITKSAGQEIDSLTLSAGYKQIIDKPTHIVNNSMSCTEFLFCTNQNTSSNYGVDVSIFDKCHRNIIFGKVNIRVSLPPVYIREVWNHSQANVENIKYAISNFYWSKAFENLSVMEKLHPLKKHY